VAKSSAGPPKVRTHTVFPALSSFMTNPSSPPFPYDRVYPEITIAPSLSATTSNAPSSCEPPLCCTHCRFPSESVFTTMISGPAPAPLRSTVSTMMNPLSGARAIALNCRLSIPGKKVRRRSVDSGRHQPRFGRNVRILRQSSTPRPQKRAP